MPNQIEVLQVRFYRNLLELTLFHFSRQFLNFALFTKVFGFNSRHPELMYTIAALLVVVYIGTLEVGIPELNDFKNR